MCQIDNSDPEYIKSSRNETGFFFSDWFGFSICQNTTERRQQDMNGLAKAILTGAD